MQCSSPISEKNEAPAFSTLSENASAENDAVPLKRSATVSSQSPSFPEDLQTCRREVAGREPCRVLRDRACRSRKARLRAETLRTAETQKKTSSDASAETTNGKKPRRPAEKTSGVKKRIHPAGLQEKHPFRLAGPPPARGRGKVLRPEIFEHLKTSPPRAGNRPRSFHCSRAAGRYDRPSRAQTFFRSTSYSGLSSSHRS